MEIGTMNEDIDNLNSIGTILYKVENEKLTIFEADGSFKLKKAKIKHKGWLQSKIFSSKDYKHLIYIEELGKWYYNKELFKEEDIQVELYDSVNDILEEDDDTIEETEILLPDNLFLSGYIIYNIINYNYITCKGYKSRLVLESELVSEKKPHISEIYKHEEHDNVYYIKEFDKWYYNSKDYFSKFIDIKLYDSFVDIPLEKLIQNDLEFSHISTIDENRESRSADIRRKNRNAIHKDLSKLGYMLLEFTSVNHIKYQIFQTREEAEEYFSYNNQITKCYHKRNDENIIYIKSLNRWINKQDENAKLYESDIDIPIKKDEKIIEIVSKDKSKLKIIVKNRKLVPRGWIFYEIVDKDYILARHYNSSNDLLTRLEMGGNDSQYYKSTIEEVCYIPKLDKWYYYDKNLETNNVKIKIYDEKEVFK